MTNRLSWLALSALLLIGGALPYPLKAQRTEAYQQSHPVFKRALELWHHEHYGAAMQQFDRYLQTGEQRLRKARASFYRARCAMALYHEDTEQQFLDYINTYPEIGNTNRAYFYLGKYHFRQENYSKTLKYLAKSEPQELKPEREDASRFMLGYAQYKAGNQQAAKQPLARLLDHPNAYRARASYYYGYINYQEKDYDTALQRFRAIQDNEKFSRIVPVYITQLYLLKQQYDSTLAYGQQVVEANEAGKLNTIKGYLGEAAYHQQAYDTVIRYLKARQQADSLSYSQQYKLAFSYLKESQYEPASAAFQVLPVQEDSLGQQVAYHLAEAYVQLKANAKARNLFEFASSLSFDTAIQEQAAFRYAKLSYDEGYQKTAKARLQAFIQKYPESAYIDEAQNLLGDLLLNTKNYQQALSIIEQVPDMNTKMQKAYQQIAYQRGLELYQDNDYANARELFIKALDYPRKPRFKALSYFWLGEAYYHLESYDKASQAYQNFLYQELAPEMAYYAVASYNIGYSHFKTEAYQKAIASFEDYRQRQTGKPANERYTDALVRLADCYFARSTYKKALKFYSKAISREHKSVPYALFQKGIIRGLQGEKDEKIRLLRQLTQNHQESPYMDDALFEIGNVYFIRGDYRMAYNQFRYLTQDYQNSSFYRLAFLKMGLVRYNQNRTQPAIRQFKTVVQKFPYSQEAKEAIDQLKTIYIDMGQADTLFSFLKSVESADLTASFQDSASYSAAFSYMKEQNCDQAIKAFREYLDDYPQGYFAINAHYYLAECAGQQGLTQQAITNYKAVVEKGATQFTTPALSTLSELYQEQGAYEKAIKYLKRLKKEADGRQNQLQALSGLMIANHRLAYYKTSAKRAKQLLDLDYLSDAKQNLARYYLAKSYFQQKQYAEALPLLEKVYKQNKGEKGAEALYLKAAVQYKQQQYKNAQQTIYKLRDEFTNYNYWVARGFVLLGDVFLKLDNAFQAKATLQSVADNYEGEELVRRAQKKLQQIREQEQAKQQPDSTNPSQPDSINKLEDD